MEEKLKHIDVELKPGAKLSRTYEFLNKIGSGGMGEIYKARHATLGKFVAIKILHQVNDQTVQRFQREAQAAFNLHHENIIAVHEFGVTEEGKPFMVMDYVDGKPLSDLITDRGALDIDLCLHLFRQICSGINHAHSKGVVHRDLKPSNIMLTEPDALKPRVQIVDFGIAKILDPESGEASKLTQTGDIIGSPLYMSPEQCLGKKVDFRSDIYSIGCIMFECLTGKPPFQGGTVMETMLDQMNTTAPPLKELGAKAFPTWLERLVAKAVAKDPDARFQSVEELKNALDTRIVAQSKQPDKPVSQPKRQVLVMTVVIVVALAAYLIAQALHINSAQQSPQSSLNDEINRLARKAQEKPAEASKLPRQPSSTVSIESSKDIMTSFDRIMDPNEYAAGMIADPLNKRIEVPDKGVEDKALVGLLNRPDVESIDFSGSKVTAKGLENLVHCNSLIHVALKDNPQINDDALAVLSKVPSIQVLNLAHTNISDDGMPQIIKLDDIRDLDLSGTKITDKTLRELGKMSGLRRLVLEHDKGVTNAGLAYLLTCKNLRRLDVGGTSVNDGGLKILSTFPKLEKLSLGDLKISDDGLAALEEMPLTKLDLNGTSITDKGLAHVVKIKTLEELSLSNVYKLDDHDGHAWELVSRLPALATLRIARTGIKNEDLSALLRCHNLQEVDISRNPNITGRELSTLAKFPLRSLNLHATSVRGPDLRILYNCKTLKELVVDPHNVSRDDCKKLKTYLPDCVVRPYDNNNAAGLEDVHF